MPKLNTYLIRAVPRKFGTAPFLVPLGVEINPRFYRGKKKALAKPKTASSKPPK